MTSLKSLVGDVLGPLLFNHPVVARVSQLAPGLRRLDLQGDDLRGRRARPGDKVQLFLPSVGPRTYSPFAFDGTRGTFSLVVHTHGDAPGATWGQRVAVGERVRLFGPRAALPLGELRGPVVLFGDETSLGAARSLVETRDGVRCVFEAGDVAAVRAACDALQLPAAVVARGAGEAPVREALAAVEPAQLVLTGQAQAIAGLRAALRVRKAPHARQHVKAHWSVGKVGLD
jgi:NADPH-dependent ferric siderophore reductase